MKLKKLTLTLMMMGISVPAFADFKVEDIRIEGLQHTEPATVFSYLPIQIGSQFNDNTGGEIIRNLYATGLFDDVRVENMGNQVLLTVIERPIISNLSVEGAALIPNEAIKKNLDAFGLGQSQPFNQQKLSEAMKALVEEYANQGKYEAKVTPHFQRLARNRIDIVLKVEEGETTTVRDIQFNGNQVFSERKLLKQMSLNEASIFTWLTKSNRFHPETFGRDLERITALYQNEGYFDFRITNTNIKTDEEKREQTIIIDVEEGKRYRWGEVSLAGDSRDVSKDELNQLIDIKKGKWYNRSQLNDLLTQIQLKLSSSGYAFSQVNVEPKPHADGTIDFVLHLSLGNKVYVNQINIVGNNKTRDEVIRREIRQMESAPYDLSKLQRSKERVELLGYFDNVTFDARPINGAPDQVDLEMAVNERSTGSLDLSAGWVQDTGLVLSAGIAQDNIFGSGKSVALRFSRSKTNQVASLSFTNPYITPDGVSLGYDIYTRSYDPSKESSSQQYKTSNTGLGTRLSVPVTEYDRVNFGVGLEHMSVNTFAGAPKRYRDFIEQYGSLNTFKDKDGRTLTDGSGSFKGLLWKGSIGWGRNKTDSALWPTRGYMIDANLEAGLPISKLQYYSLTHNQKWFFPLSEDFTLMLGGSVGYAAGYGKTKKLPFFENFYGGGLGSVRGYESGSLGPKVYDYNGSVVSYGGNKMFNATAELLFPFPGIKDTRSVRLSLFADAGSIWDDKVYDDNSSDMRNNKVQNVYGLGTQYKSTFSNELRYSAGAAFTWLSPIGPMKLSYALPLKKKETDQVQRFQFQLGTTF